MLAAGANLIQRVELGVARRRAVARTVRRGLARRPPSRRLRLASAARTLMLNVAIRTPLSEVVNADTVTVTGRSRRRCWTSPPTVADHRYVTAELSADLHDIVAP